MKKDSTFTQDEKCQSRDECNHISSCFPIMTLFKIIPVIKMKLKGSKMTNQKHTPGPWLGEAEIWAIDGQIRVAQAYGLSKVEKEANAHLISAAPELLVACEEIIQDMGAEDAPWFDKLKAAIAKVRGE